ncbi:MAG: polysaccharide deacetylase family protein, partial [Oscillospiraceae bacterium]|nr:polysaccharide deacetylase family protein [Oscillospiraceae bacterium]
MKKRFISLILIICISALLFSVPSGAASEVFVAAGNTVLPLTDAMPIRSSGVWYIDYQCFTKGGLNVNSSYNASERTLVLYTWDTTLVFDLNSTTAYTTTEKVPYKAVAFVSSGTVYVPAQFTAQMLGFECSYLSDPVMIRIKRSTDIPNNIFQYIAQNEAPGLIAAYNESKKNNSDVKPPSGSSSDESEDSTVRKSIRLTFNITDGFNMSKILDTLSRYGYHATFFIRGSAIDNCENELRRAVSGGHSLGMLSQNGSSDFSAGGDVLKNALSSCND